jgi:hypothetical protein
MRANKSLPYVVYGGVDMFMICLWIKFHTNMSCGPLSVIIKPLDTDTRTEAMSIFHTLNNTTWPEATYFSNLSPNINPGLKNKWLYILCHLTF